VLDQHCVQLAGHERGKSLDPGGTDNRPLAVRAGKKQDLPCARSGVGDYLSGLLLGAEIAAARRWLEEMRVAATRLTLVGAQALADKYRTALAIAGIDADVGAEDAAARGLWRIARHAGMLG
jgi:2-keto-3-deoxy-galactonokinase